MARGEHGGEVGPATVAQTFVRSGDHLRLLTLATPNGTDVVRTTDEHPFWVSERGWIDAEDLRVGDELVGLDCSPAAWVQATERVDRPAGVALYNFEVAGRHTYFVAPPDARGPPVLVHNADGYDFARMRHENMGIANSTGRYFDLTPGERSFVAEVMRRKPGLQVFRTNQRVGLGDFLIIDRSNPKRPMGFLVDHKSGGGGAGNQLRDAADAVREFGLDNLETASGTTRELIELISRGRGRFPGS